LQVIGKGEGENVWLWVHKFIELDKEKGKAGDSLDEFQAHRFLEQIGINREKMLLYLY
jgi:hypothetical protein